jgi:hypothetical protein
VSRRLLTRRFFVGSGDAFRPTGERFKLTDDAIELAAFTGDLIAAELRLDGKCVGWVASFDPFTVRRGGFGTIAFRDTADALGFVARLDASGRVAFIRVVGRPEFDINGVRSGVSIDRIEIAASPSSASGIAPFKAADNVAKPRRPRRPRGS